MPRLIYTLLLYLLLPLTPLKLLWRGLRQPEYRQHWGERFGYYRGQRTQTQPLIWLHCVSVGETRGAAPLVRELQARHPNHRILLTHATPTGREAGEQLFGDQVERTYLPYDVPGAVHRFLQHYRPAIGLLQRDGVSVLLGHISNVVTILYFSLLIGGGGLAVRELINRMAG